VGKEKEKKKQKAKRKTTKLLRKVASQSLFLKQDGGTLKRKTLSLP